MKSMIILNGPPGSGKDTVGGILLQKLDGYHVEFKEALITLYDAVVAGTRKVTKGRSLITVRVPQWFEADKDIPQKALKGKTPRQEIIRLSEEWAKPIFGDDVFGRAVLNRTRKSVHNGWFVCTDGGFRAEIEPILESMTVYIAQIEREGCTFENDSRSYVGGHEFSTALPYCTRSERFSNNESPEECVRKILSWISRWRPEVLVTPETCCSHPSIVEYYVSGPVGDGSVNFGNNTKVHGCSSCNKIVAVRDGGLKK